MVEFIISIVEFLEFPERLYDPLKKEMQASIILKHLMQATLIRYPHSHCILSICALEFLIVVSFQSRIRLFGLLCMQYLTIKHLGLAVEAWFLTVLILSSNTVSDHSYSRNQDSEEVATCQCHQVEGDCDI
jgi:hypothetical protein